MFKFLKRYLIISVLIYLISTPTIMVINKYRYHLKKERLLSKYDTNNNGTIDFEDSVDFQDVSDQINALSRDTGQSMAPFTLIPIALIFGFIISVLRNRLNHLDIKV